MLERSQGQKGHYDWLIREALLDVMSGQDIRCWLASYVPSVTLVHHAEEVWINKKTGETYRKDKTDHRRKTSENISMTARSRFPDILDMIKTLQGGTADSRARPPHWFVPWVESSGGSLCELTLNGISKEVWPLFFSRYVCLLVLGPSVWPRYRFSCWPRKTPTSTGYLSAKSPTLKRTASSTYKTRKGWLKALCKRNPTR